MNTMIMRSIIKLFQRVRIVFYLKLSKNHFQGNPSINLPVIFNGNGSIHFDEGVQLGFNPSPGFYDGSGYIESRNKEASIKVGKHVFINNNFRFICDKTFIHIGNNVLIGTNVEILDSDFHELNPQSRNSGFHLCRGVIIEDNVFIGNNVTILKGCQIGKNSVVANGSVVTKSFPKNVIVGGNPARIIKEIIE